VPGRKIGGDREAGRDQQTLELAFIGEHGQADVTSATETIERLQQIGRNVRLMQLRARVTRDFNRVARAERRVLKRERTVIRMMRVGAGEHGRRVRTVVVGKIERVEDRFTNEARGGERLALGRKPFELPADAERDSRQVVLTLPAGDVDAAIMADGAHAWRHNVRQNPIHRVISRESSDDITIARGPRIIHCALRELSCEAAAAKIGMRDTAHDFPGTVPCMPHHAHASTHTPTIFADEPFVGASALERLADKRRVLARVRRCRVRELEQPGDLIGVPRPRVTDAMR
jgi:hypothetical protein